MEAGAQIDVFDHPYYKINKTFMTFLGQWPYQNTRVRFAKLAVILFLYLTQIIPQGIAIVKHRNDWDTLIDCAAPLSFSVFCLVKITFSTLNSEKMSMLLNHMRRDWEIFTENQDADILHDYAKTGRILTITYAVAGYTCIILFLLEPIVPKIIDVLLRNGTAHAELPIPLEYVIIDVQEYYFYVVGYLFVIVLGAFATIVANDTLFMVYIHHGCGLYAALGRKLQQTGKTKEIRHVFGKTKSSFDHLASCIDRHNEAIEYAELIEASYSSSFLLIVGFNIILISVTGYQIVTRTMGLQDTVRFVASNLNGLGHLFFANYMGQLLMDHSISIPSHILNSDWYKLPISNQKLLLCVIMRCSIPSKITAGTISTMSIETFEAVLKTSLSYFTVLRSM